jgi:hypothetical protein
MFNDPMEFKAISRKAILRLTPKFSAEWEKEELCSTLPLCVIGKLQENSIYCDVTELSRVNNLEIFDDDTEFLLQLGFDEVVM